MTDVSPIEPRTHSLSPWMVIGGIVLFVMSLAVGISVIAALLEPKPSPIPEGIAKATLEDGTVLVLRDAIVGSNELEFSLPSNSWPVRLGWEDPPTQSFHASSHGQGLIVWFSRHDAQTGHPLAFDRWTHCLARTTDGGEIIAEHFASRHTRDIRPGHVSTSTSGANPPFSPLDPGVYSHILYAATLPLLRPAGTHFELEIHDGHDVTLATMSVPYPASLGPFPTWVPDPLPATKSDGPVEVTLTQVTSQRHPNERLAPRVEVVTKMEIREDGEPSSLWTPQLRLSDALGNESYPYDCTLPATEAAWNVQARLFRVDTGPFSADQRLGVEDIELPDNDPATLPNSVLLTESLTWDGVTVAMLGIGGPGKATYQFNTSESNITHRAGEGIAAEFRTPNGELTIDNSQRHIALQIEGRTPEHQVGLLLTDQSGIQLSTGHPKILNEVHIWTFDVDEWVTAVNAYVTVQRARTVDFTVSPPPPE